jgi:hypothetical protein
MIILMKSRRMRWAENVARIGRIGVHIGYCWESRKERDFGKTKTYVKYEGTVVLLLN